MAGITFVISVNQAQDLIQLRATDAEGNMISSDVQKIDRPYCGTKTVTIDIPDDMIKHATKKNDIVLDKTKSKPWVRPSDRYDAVRYAWKIAHGDMFPNVYELAEKKGFENLMKLVDWDTHNPYLECLFHDTHHQPFYDGNHTNREKEKPMKTKKDIDRIVITKDGESGVLLRAYSDDEIVEKTIAKCSPDDIFDFNIGAKLAVDRLYDGYDMTPKPKRKLYNGKIFMRADMKSYDGFWGTSCCKYTRVNKIWDVKDGKIIGFGGALRPVDLIYEDMTDEELTKLLTKTNSLYIGYFYNIVDGYFVR